MSTTHPKPPTQTELQAVDRHVGARIRERRVELGVSQEQLAAVIGLTFQQVQKYERAANRVSASRLVSIAHALRVAPAYFFDGLDLSPAPKSYLKRDRLRMEINRRLIDAPTRTQRAVLDVIKAMTADSDTTRIAA